MKKISTILLMSIAFIKPALPQQEAVNQQTTLPGFKFLTEQFADAKILRYQVPGFENLSLKQKTLIYYLSQAALSGRDITYDQNYKNNLLIRRTLEAIQEGYTGNRDLDDFNKFTVYLKRVWFCNGIHHHYSTDKILPEFHKEFFSYIIDNTPKHKLPLAKGQTVEQFIEEITPLVFNPDLAPKRVSLNPEKDLVEASASNFYDGVNQAEAEEFYRVMKAEAKKSGKDTLVSF
ncbi:MAG TPA: dihydrofolate reductase, partial [Bacteroidales bacterium]|nr:dihydrofolate reductase [Bacteroidales bacterium]